MDDTIKSNVVISDNSRAFKAERFKRALEISKVEDFLIDLSGGIEHYAGEDGALISGGQRQRIGISRALYKDFDVLILDEATSALDEKTALEVIKRIIETYVDQIIIIISHKPEIIELFNK